MKNFSFNKCVLRAIKKAVSVGDLTANCACSIGHVTAMSARTVPKVGQPMLKYVYDLPSSGGARLFYISGNYVYSFNGGQPAYFIDGEYWYTYPSSVVLFYVSGGYVYPHEGGRAKYHVR
jgi:hypothetical protein